MPTEPNECGQFAAGAAQETRPSATRAGHLSRLCFVRTTTTPPQTEYRKLQDEIIDPLKFLRTRATTGELNPALGRLCSFQEVKQNWLGFTHS
jgi:hypothetical protein